jgi:hypothetical protein
MTKIFQIVNSSELDLEFYESLDFVAKNKNSFDRLRTLTNFIEPRNYKGFGRTTFTADPFYFKNATKQIMVLPNTTITSDENKLAKYKLLEIENKQTENFKIDWYFDNLEDAISVYELLEDRTKFEKIELILGQKEILPKSYGFDIGYSTADFSIIADTAIKPMWHPPDFDDMDDIISQMKKLNQYCLFDTYADALDYKEIYLSKKWAEENWFENDNEGDIKIVLVSPK